ncbi:MAG: hypothetical protein J5981_03615 [Lachnospira sp.]|nr:hypothetical protein [Lachnospira sp.]
MEQTKKMKEETAVRRNYRDRVFRLVFGREEALLELDKNTVQYMIDEMQETIDSQQKQLEEKQETIDSQQNQLEEKQETIDSQKNQLEETNRLLSQALEKIKQLENAVNGKQQ